MSAPSPSPQTIARPELTLPAPEAALLRDTYAAAEVILEYGSGGSTVMAGEMAGTCVFSVESDRDWAQMMRAWFAANPPLAEVDVIWADIGRTKEWGHPASDRGWRRFARYPLEVWDLPEFRHPDAVLVDGRFRLGCVLATMLRITRPVTLLFDDYAQRDQYHRIEEFTGPPAGMTGRMARFELSPRPVPPERLLTVIDWMQRP